MCKICGSADDEYILSVEARRYAVGENFELHKCKNCTSVYLHPQLNSEELKKYYPESYDPHKLDKNRQKRIRRNVMQLLRKFIYGGDYSQRNKHKNFLKNLLSSLFDRFSYRSVPPYKKGGRILDIGCGVGAYLSILKKMGWQEYGVETNPAASTYARQSLGLEVQHRDFENAEFPEKYFDVITLWHSLEHLSDPRTNMQKIRRLLKDDGMLMLGLPNFSSLDRKLFGASWNGLEIPLHVFHFSPDSIHCLLRETGFKCQKIVHTIRPSDMAKSINNFLQDNHYLKPNRFLAFFSYVMSIPLVIIFSLMRRSSIIKIYAGT